MAAHSRGRSRRSSKRSYAAYIIITAVVLFAVLIVVLIYTSRIAPVCKLDVKGLSAEVAVLKRGYGIPARGLGFPRLVVPVRIRGRFSLAGRQNRQKHRQCKQEQGHADNNSFHGFSSFLLLDLC